MSRYTKTQITQLSANEQAAIDSINKNFQDIQEAIADTVSRSGNVPTHMTADFDLNGKRIINTSAPKTDNDFVRRVDVVGDIATVQSLVNATTNAAAQTLQAAQEVQEIIQDRNVGLVADDLALGDDSKIKQVAGNKDNIDLVASLDDDIEAVAALKDDIPVVVQAAEDIDKVEDIAEDITAVANNAANVTAVAENEENINAVNANKTNINAVNSNKTNIDTVATNVSDVETVAGSIANVNTVAGSDTNIGTVATNISDVNDCATNMSAIQAAPSAASSAAASAEQAAISAAGTHFKLFQHGWFDYQLDDMAWLRADTFSWQDGTVYSDAYNHLVDDIDGKTATSETIGSYTISYYLADDGHKITTDETNVLNIYNESGVAWYYVLDTANTRFKLPRTKFGFTGLRDTVGKYVEAGLPNISGTFGANFTQGNFFNKGTGAFGSYRVSNENTNAPSQGSAYSNNNMWDFDASRSSSIYGNSTTVQPPATQMYLYFYVGQFSQSATEQTAGLNSELFNGKVDLNASNLSTQGKSLISGLGMPSDRYTNITLLASGNTYTAPANGWFSLDGTVSNSSNNFINLIYDGTDTLGVRNTSCVNSTNAIGVITPARKGDKVRAYYTNVTNIRFRFIYAEGEQ